MDAAAETVLKAFAQLYYYIPTLAKSLSITIGNNTIVISEPKDAVLWLCKLLTQHTGSLYCRYQDLEKLVVRWYPTARDNFSGLLTELEYQDGCLKRFLEKDVPDRTMVIADKPDNRRKWVMLTPTGERVLERLRSKRQKDLLVLFRVLRRKNVGRFEQSVSDLAAIGDAAWLAMLKATEKPKRRAHK
jgi:hypothetical protein